MTLEHVEKYAEELKEAGITSEDVSPIIASTLCTS